MDPWATQGEVIVRILLSVVFGGLIGLEREWQGKPAGLRTHILVCVGSATFTLIAFDLFWSVQQSEPRPSSMDPIRVVEGIIGGLGFLGAGSIIQSRGNVEGLTTASGLWLVGAIGVATGGGYYLIGGVAVVVGLLVILGLGILEKKVARSSTESRP